MTLQPLSGFARQYGTKSNGFSHLHNVRIVLIDNNNHYQKNTTNVRYSLIGNPTGQCKEVPFVRGFDIKFSGEVLRVLLRTSSHLQSILADELKIAPYFAAYGQNQNLWATDFAL